MACVLVPLPDHDFDVTEVAVPWKLLRRAGHEVVFATEHGAQPAADPRLLTGVIFGKLGAEPEPKAFYAELTEDPAFRSPARWSELDVRGFDALVLPGGHAPGMRQYLGSDELQRAVQRFWDLGRPVGAICHGVLVLARCRNSEGLSPLRGVRTTCLPKYMERAAYLSTFWKLGRYYRTYPAYVEDEVRAALASHEQFVRGPFELSRRGTDSDDSPAFVVDDGRYVSARWPGDAYLFAKKLIERLA
ncbi:MAG TPA: type 1 glutamine amidotransferase domain-containing protein [Polyangiaceae bacterium]